jgi:hypothetical protein
VAFSAGGDGGRKPPELSAAIASCHKRRVRIVAADWLATQGAGWLRFAYVQAPQGYFEELLICLTTVFYVALSQLGLVTQFPTLSSNRLALIAALGSRVIWATSARNVMTPLPASYY